MQIEYYLNSPLRHPNWRHVLAMEGARDPEALRCVRRRRDQALFSLHEFLRDYRRVDEDRDGRARLFARAPGQFYAYELMLERDEQEQRAAYVIEARLLAGQTDEQIAKLTGTLPATVKWYHDWFFHVRDRLANKDWVVQRVLGPAAVRGRRDLSYNVMCKLYGYFGGPIVLDSLLYCTDQSLDPPDNARDVRDFMDKNVAHEVRRRAMLELPGANFDAVGMLELTNAAVRLRELEAEMAAMGASLDRPSYESNVVAIMQQLKWVTGQPRTVAGFETSAAELRADEEFQQLLGELTEQHLEPLQQLTLPSPSRVLERQEDEPHEQTE